MDLFVTGATGKVGSRFVPRLLQRGHHVHYRSIYPSFYTARDAGAI
jgi:nucleoside-diphosphate-sugar epimerase